ncbi:MAG: glycosyltransferase family 4 protein [Thermodesulfobacteriota bacterium]
MELPRILHVITRMDRGGSAQNTLATCQGLADRYRQTLVFGPTLESEMGPEEQAEVSRELAEAQDRGVEVLVAQDLVRAISPLKDAGALRELFRIIRERRPQIVHTHSSKAGLLGRLAARAARVPAVIHTPHGHVFSGHFGPAASRVFLAVERAAARITDRTVALTEGERNDYLALKVGAPESIVVIHSGVPLERFSRQSSTPADARESLGLGPDGPVVGTVGWLLPIKGPGTLLAAMGRVWETHPDAVLVYVGQGPLQEELAREASRMGKGKNVIFTGWRSDVENLLPAFDVFVLASENEGMGRAVVEAMAAGKPVAASRVGGIPDLVRDGETGFLVPPGDSPALAGAIETLLADPARASAMGEKGRELAPAFSLSAMLEKLDRLYGDVLLDGAGR